MLNGNIIDVVGTHTYLGVCLADSSSDNTDISRQTKAIYGRGNVLIKKFSYCDDNVKVRLFKAYCSSFYCSQLWSTYCDTSFNKLRSAYNRILRHLFNLPRDCSISAECIRLNLNCFIVTLRKSIFSFRCRLLNCDNNIVQSIEVPTYKEPLDHLYSSQAV